jgi:hypothetical protein
MHHLIKSLQSKGKPVTPASIETESLFHAGGTVTRKQANTFIKSNRVKMSVLFGRFERTGFFEMSEAIGHVRKNRLPYVRLQQGNLSWDNF